MTPASGLTIRSFSFSDHHVACLVLALLSEILHRLEYLWEGLPPMVRATVHRHRIHQPHHRNPFLFPAQN
ncbi:hypothetical protein, partial [Turicimonas sp. TL08]